MKTLRCYPRLTSRRRRRWGGDEQGQSLLEFAIAAVALFTLVCGILEFSRYLYTYHFVSEATREATRYAAVRGYTFNGTSCTVYTPTGPGFFDCAATNTNVTNYVVSLAPTGINQTASAWVTSSTCSAASVTSPTVSTCWPETTPDSPSTVVTACASHSNSPGCYVQVEISYPYQFMIPFLPGGASTHTISSTSEEVIQQ